MALYFIITQNDGIRIDCEWHVGEPTPKLIWEGKAGLSVSADGYELNAVILATNLTPDIDHGRVATYKGAFAFITIMQAIPKMNAIAHHSDFYKL